ncbi:hypothetical protein [Skermanella stibiiresistens]|uniref:hypothetical protein n=1 Tax=Skermanella stibiiresistens TaxID=913326 RepID=UPI0012FCB6BC|nr:hypothetical protein [Skermanella stibiiresistens]
MKDLLREGILSRLMRVEEAMGQTEFLTGISGTFPSVQNAIEELQNLSTIFMNRWHRGQSQQAGNASEKAMVCFDHVVGEIMRARESRKYGGTYAGSPFEVEMIKPLGLIATNASLAEHQMVRMAGPGNGSLPSRSNGHASITLEKTLNKVKHRSKLYMNFRITNSRHIFVICPENTHDGSPESVIEFDVEDFCQLCLQTAAVM